MGDNRKQVQTDVSRSPHLVTRPAGLAVNHSPRFRWNPRPNALALEKAALQAAGRRLFDLTISNPTQAGVTYPEQLLTALDDQRALRYQPEATGLLATREAVAEYYSSHGARVHPDQVILTASTSEAYHYLFKLLANPGDEILVPLKMLSGGHEHGVLHRVHNDLGFDALFLAQNLDGLIDRSH